MILCSTKLLFFFSQIGKGEESLLQYYRKSIKCLTVQLKEGLKKREKGGKKKPYLKWYFPSVFALLKDKWNFFY